MTLETLYMDYLKYTDEKIGEGVPPLEIAAILASQSLSLYRTVLNEEDYQKIVLAIFESKDRVKTFGNCEPTTFQ